MFCVMKQKDKSVKITVAIKIVLQNFAFSQKFTIFSPFFPSENKYLGKNYFCEHFFGPTPMEIPLARRDIIPLIIEFPILNIQQAAAAAGCGPIGDTGKRFHKWDEFLTSSNCHIVSNLLQIKQIIIMLASFLSMQL